MLLDFQLHGKTNLCGSMSESMTMRQTSLPKLKTLDDFSKDEVKKFDEMLKVLAAYNASLGTDHELPLPPYSDEEMAEFSGYRQLVIAKECEG